MISEELDVSVCLRMFVGAVMVGYTDNYRSGLNIYIYIIDQSKHCKIKSKTSIKITILHTHQVWWYQNGFHLTIAAPHISEPLKMAHQLLQERPPWNLSRSKRPGRWQRDAKHLAEKPRVPSLGMRTSPVKTPTSWDFDGFPAGSMIRDEHFQWNQ